MGAVTALRGQRPIPDHCDCGYAGDVHGGAGYLYRRGRPALHRGQRLGHQRRSYLGADQLPGCECHHSSRQQLVLHQVRTQRFLIACIAIFTVSSFFCGAATSLGFILLARALQGAGGGALQPLSQAILLESFPPKTRLAMSAFALGVVVAPVLGPTLGGWLTETYSWRWAFYINIPVGILAILLIARASSKIRRISRMPRRVNSTAGAWAAGRVAGRAANHPR